jgi:prepilin-type N-terminal cleavage/methylation domain-containing protein
MMHWIWKIFERRQRADGPYGPVAEATRPPVRLQRIWCGRPPKANRRRAFTLIEMLAALALAMILLYMLFQIFATAGRAMAIANARTETHANARYILHIMHQEISGAFLDTSQDADADSDADYLVVTTDTWNPPWDASLTYDADALQFLTSSALGKSGALGEVAYWLDTTDAQNPILRRRLASDPTNYEPPVPAASYTVFDASNKVLDMDGDDVIEVVDDKLPVSADPQNATILGENILAFEVEYYDVTTDTFATGNYTAQEKTLAPALRITLTVRDSKGRIAEGEQFTEIIHIKGRE